ncbi:MAG: class I SAM-dependent methyltransferase [Acidimicrobiales bacterium]
MDSESLQAEWDAQQSAYMPDREERFAAMLDFVEAVRGTSPRVLDLAGGTGSITRRLLVRMPGARSVLVDVDPALLAIATATFAGDDRVRVCAADLASPAWVAELGTEPATGAPTGGTFDAVLTATALHWLPPQRVAEVYREAGSLLRAGGVLANADHMPDPGLDEKTRAAIDAFAGERSKRARAETGALDWNGWWERLAGDPELAGAVSQRNARFAERAGAQHTESDMDAWWHIGALRAAGFAAAGLVWRGLGDAVVVGVRP